MKYNYTTSYWSGKNFLSRAGHSTGEVEFVDCPLVLANTYYINVIRSGNQDHADIKKLGAYKTKYPLQYPAQELPMVEAVSQDNYLAARKQLDDDNNLITYLNVNEDKIIEILKYAENVRVKKPGGKLYSNREKAEINKKIRSLPKIDSKTRNYINGFINNRDNSLSFDDLSQLPYHQELSDAIADYEVKYNTSNPDRHILNPGHEETTANQIIKLQNGASHNLHNSNCEQYNQELRQILGITAKLKVLFRRPLGGFDTCIKHLVVFADKALLDGNLTRDQAAQIKIQLSNIRNKAHKGEPISIKECEIAWPSLDSKHEAATASIRDKIQYEEKKFEDNSEAKSKPSMHEEFAELSSAIFSEYAKVFLDSYNQDVADNTEFLFAISRLEKYIKLKAAGEITQKSYYELSLALIYECDKNPEMSKRLSHLIPKGQEYAECAKYQDFIKQHSHIRFTGYQTRFKVLQSKSRDQVIDPLGKDAFDYYINTCSEVSYKKSAKLVLNSPSSQKFRKQDSSSSLSSQAESKEAPVKLQTPKSRKGPGKAE